MQSLYGIGLYLIGPIVFLLAGGTSAELAQYNGLLFELLCSQLLEPILLYSYDEYLAAGWAIELLRFAFFCAIIDC